VIACGLVVLCGCSDDPDSATGNSDSTSAPSAEESATSADGSGEPPGSEPTESATTVAPTVESTADRSVAPPAEVVQVVGVEVPAAADGPERIVIDTAGGTPGYRLRYVDAVRIDGEPVLVDGNAFLELVLKSADPAGDQGTSDEVAVDLMPDQPLIKHVQMAYYLGDELTYAIGLDRVVPFAVTTTDNQIVITFTP